MEMESFDNAHSANLDCFNNKFVLFCFIHHLYSLEPC